MRFNQSLGGSVSEIDELSIKLIGKRRDPRITQSIFGKAEQRQQACSS